MILPLSTTYILSELRIVDNLCAITIVVLFKVNWSNAFWIFASVLESIDDVASSSNIILLFFRKALAIYNLCFAPPDNFTPFSPIMVS